MRFFLLALSLLILFPVFGQELPPVINYSPTSYGAGNQNWMISQGAGKNIYVANGTGLLEFTGAKWNLYPMPNNSIVRSVEVVDDRIFTGAYMEFGYWEKGETGSLCYTSLISQFPKPVDEGEQFWHITKVGEVILFQSFDALYKYDIQRNEISRMYHSTSNPIKNLFKVKNSIYFVVDQEGLFIIRNGSAENILSNEALEKIEIVYIFNSDNGLNLVSRDGSFYIWNGKEISQYNYGLTQKLAGKSIFSAIVLEDRSLVIGTVEDGLFYVSSQGEIISHFNQENGLLNNTVLSVFIDEDKNIWAGLDNGISVINLHSPFKIFQDHKGKIGSVYTSYQAGQSLYLGTNQGLYYRSDPGQQFKLIEGTNGQVWSLQEIDGILWCGHNTGTFIIEGDIANKVANRNGTWTVKKLKSYPGYYIQGHYNGISLLRIEGDSIKDFPVISGFPYSSKFILSEQDGNIWIGNEHKGVFRLRLSQSMNGISEIENYTFPEVSGLTSSIFKFNDTLYYATKDHIFQFDQKQNVFSKENELSKIVGSIDRSTGKFISEQGKKIWGFGNNRIFSVGLDHINTGYDLQSIHFSRSLRNITQGYENLTLLNSGWYLMGVAGGYLKFDQPTFKNDLSEIRIDRIELSALDKASEEISLRNLPAFHYKRNNISFHYSIAEFNKHLAPVYSFRLVGLSPRWSGWTDASKADFRNLPFGDYNFEVKGRIGERITPIETYSFSIARPWYLSLWAIIIYSLCLMLVLLFVHHIYRRKHKKLIAENERALQLTNLEAEQKIIKIQKEQLEKEMDGKNKELAVSTMNLIKKNEFLTTIKEELKNSDQSAEVRSVIKTIEKDISEKDNWNFFKEAFRNADKDFFKKIKSSHPELTTNDLKLCAYLRLNLSSKEIAPLLNISVKSVEIKRYRLRKKMNLSREISLTGYVLSI